MSSAGYIFHIKQPNPRMLNGLHRILSLVERMAPNHPNQQKKHPTQSRTAGSDSNGQSSLERSCVWKDEQYMWMKELLEKR